MTSKKPVVRQIAWSSMIVQVIILLVLMYFFIPELVLLIYLALTLLLRMLIPKNHRKGISLSKAGNYAEAVGEFEKSYEFFTMHPWIDKYRFITLLSNSRISYREMALINMAYSYSQTGDGENSKKYYEKALEQFPDSEMAKAALQMIHSFENTASPRQ